jgi:hypothetical protein
MRSATRSSGAILTRLSPSTYSLWRARRQGLGIAIGGAVELGNALSSSWACSRNCSPPPVGVCGSPCSNGACSGARNQFSCESLFQHAHDRFAIASRHGAVFDMSGHGGGWLRGLERTRRLFHLDSRNASSPSRDSVLGAGEERQSLPMSRRIIRIRTISPNPPLG